MNEHYQFVKKIISSLPFMTERKLYGKISFYYKETPLLLIDGDSIILHVENIDQVPTLKQAMNPWSLDGRPMPHWYSLPGSYNKKKNKLQPAIELAISTWDKSKRSANKTMSEKKNKKMPLKTSAPPSNQAASEKIEDKENCKNSLFAHLCDLFKFR